MVPCSWVEGIKPLWYWQQGSLHNQVGVFHAKVDDGWSSETLTERSTYLFHTPYGLATMTQFHK